MKRERSFMWAAVFVVVLTASIAFAQGGGSSATGTIDGKVSDTTGAMLPGVTVTITSPSLMGTRSAVTNASGIYRFPAVPPGIFAITYELGGFNTLKREGIDVVLGFTASVNVELSLATIQETVAVTGESPVIDTSVTRVQQNFKLQQLESLPNARDIWALLAVTPGVAMTRIDVGGNRAGTQTGYTAYGYGGQVRAMVEGINTTEGTGGAGFYYDYGSFEEAFIGAAAQGAEMPHPGVQSQFLGKSGGNRLQGQVYLDYENNHFQGSNIPDALIERGIRRRSNEIQRYRDFNVNVGGPIRKDKIWWYSSYRNQFNAITRANFRFAKTFDTELWNLSGKGTYQLSQNNRFIGYYQWGQKTQPNRPGSDTFTYLRPEDTRLQDSGSWVWKGEWNSTLSNNLYVEARYGDFGYYFPQIGYSDQPYIQNRQTQIIEGGDLRNQLDRDRKQLTGAATYFKDRFLGGSHNFKFGGEMMFEGRFEGRERTRAGNIEHIFGTNGQALQVVLGFPTASGPLGTYGSRKFLLSIAKMDHLNAFISDQWSHGRMTVNVGARFDHYKVHIPDQRQLPFTNGPITLEEKTIPARTFFTWNSVVPRIGLIYDLLADGRTVLKANYGYFKHNPGTAIADSANPNQAAKTITYRWTDRNGDGLFQSGEQGSVVSTALEGQVQVDPNISQPYTHEASIFLERQLRNDIGARVGFVYKTDDNQWQTYRPFRPIEAYTAPFSCDDNGANCRAGSDGPRVFLAIPEGPGGTLPPATSVIQNVPAIGRYKTLEASLNKRFSSRWSAGLGFGYTWTKENGTTYRGNTVSPSLYKNSPNDTDLHEFTNWGFKAHGTYDAPWTIKLTPILRHQSGQPYGRTISVSAPSGLFYSATAILAEPLNSRRMDNINILDIRAEKVLSHHNLRLRLFLDVFNILNSHASEVISFTSGSAFELPQNIVAPRVARVGFRFDW